MNKEYESMTNKKNWTPLGKLLYWYITETLTHPYKDTPRLSKKDIEYIANMAAEIATHCLDKYKIYGLHKDTKFEEIA